MIGKFLTFFIKREYIVYILFISCTAVTLALTLSPPSNFQGHSVFQYDKLGHFLMFFGWTLMFGLSWMIRKKNPVSLWIVFFTGLIFGITIEITQGFLPYERHPNPFDVVANGLGSLFAVIILNILQQYYIKFFKTSHHHKK